MHAVFHAEILAIFYVDIRGGVHEEIREEIREELHSSRNGWSQWNLARPAVPTAKQEPTPQLDEETYDLDVVVLISRCFNMFFGVVIHRRPPEHPVTLSQALFASCKLAFHASF